MITNKVFERLYANDATVSHFLNCIGVPFKEADTIENYSSTFRKMSDENYPRLLSLLHKENDSRLPSILKDLDFLHNLFINVFEAKDKEEVSIYVINMHKAKKLTSIHTLKSIKYYYDSLRLVKKRSLPDNYFEYMTNYEEGPADETINSREIYLNDLPNEAKPLRNVQLVESMIVNIDDGIFTIKPKNVDNIFFYTSIANLQAKAVKLAKSISRSKTKKQEKALEGAAISELISKNLISPLDVIVMPTSISGIILRGKLTVKYELLGLEREEVLPNSRLLADNGEIKIFRSKYKINTPLGKKDIILIYHDI